MASQQWIVRLKMREVNLDGSDQGLDKCRWSSTNDPWSSQQTSYHGQDVMREKGPLFSSEQMQWTNLGWHFELDDRQARSVLFKCCNSQANATLTPGSNAQQQQQPLEERTRTILSSCEHHDHRSMTGLCEYMSDMRDDNTPRHQRGYARSSSQTVGCVERVKKTA